MDEGSLRQVESIAAYMAMTCDLDRFDYATELALQTQGLAKEECGEENRVLGCDSRLWFRLDALQGAIRLRVESDSLLVKGLAQMLADACAVFPAGILARRPLGLSKLLYARGWIPLARRRGLDELEERICQFARQHRETQSGTACTFPGDTPTREGTHCAGSPQCHIYSETEGSNQHETRDGGQDQR